MLKQTVKISMYYVCMYVCMYVLRAFACSCFDNELTLSSFSDLFQNFSKTKYQTTKMNLTRHRLCGCV